MTDLIYLKDSYKRSLETSIVSVTKKGDLTELILAETIFYPQGGGQPSDTGEIKGSHGKAHVKHVRMQGDSVIHECTVEGQLKPGDHAECRLDWNRRYFHMRSHSAGHLVHEAVIDEVVGLIPTKGEHGDRPFIEYKGSIPIGKKELIQKAVNNLVEKSVTLSTEFVTLEELKSRSPFVPEHLPKHKPLRILTVGNRPPIPDGGTQVKNSREVGPITISEIDNAEDSVRVYYGIEREPITSDESRTPEISTNTMLSLMLDYQTTATREIEESNEPTDLLKLAYLGGKSEFARLAEQITGIPKDDRARVGMLINQVKAGIDIGI